MVKGTQAWDIVDFFWPCRLVGIFRKISILFFLFCQYFDFRKFPRYLKTSFYCKFSLKTCWLMFFLVLIDRFLFSFLRFWFHGWLNQRRRNFRVCSSMYQIYDGFFIDIWPNAQPAHNKFHHSLSQRGDDFIAGSTQKWFYRWLNQLRNVSARSSCCTQPANLSFELLQVRHLWAPYCVHPVILSS
jgi:hypothetical protein